MALVLSRARPSGCVAELHDRYHAAHAGSGVYFESKVARVLPAFCEGYDEARDGPRLAQALAFCDARGYCKVYLGAFVSLHAARQLYESEKNGFRLMQRQPGRQWGADVLE